MHHNLEAPLVPNNDDEPHSGMVAGTVAGMDALLTHGADEMDVENCDGELGAKTVDVEVWPSPFPLPSAHPSPSPIIILNANFTSNFTSNSTGPRPIQPVAPVCEDDASFRDANGLSCQDYTMNKDLCLVAARYMNRQAQSARHACCKCGGGVHVLPSVEKRCERPAMGGSGDCTEEERNEVIRVMDSGEPSGDFDSDNSRAMGGEGDANEVDLEDQVEDAAVDRLGTMGSVDGILAPDSVVFRNRNFIGYPKEPESQGMQPTGRHRVTASFLVNGTFVGGWQGMYGPMIEEVLGRIAFAKADLTSVTPVPSKGLLVAFSVGGEHGLDDEEGRQALAALSQAFASGMFARALFERGLNVRVVVQVQPTLQPVLAEVPFVLGEAPITAHYTTFPYTVRHGDTFQGIAERFNTTPAQLIAFNEDLVDPLMVKKGDILFIPKAARVGITGVSPLEAPLEGGVDVVIKGKGFAFPAHCKFGDVVSRASYVVDDTIVCPAPEQSEPGLYQLSVSDGKGGFHDSAFSFHYTVGTIPFCDEPSARPSWCRPRLGIYGVSPLRIPQDVEANIVVIGAGFNASTICMIGSEAVPTTVVSRSNLTCFLSARGPSINSITLLQGSLRASTQYEIVVYSTLSVVAVTPEHGPEIGGTELSLTGTSFKKTSVCRFGDIVVPATFVRPSVIKCTTPPTAASVVRVEVSNDGRAFAPSAVPFEFTELKINSVTPNQASVVGGSIVVLDGYGFYPGMWCRFGVNKTLAEYNSLSSARCMVPPQSTARTVRVAVSLDGHKAWTDEDVSFDYYGAVTEVRPAEGRGLGGDDIHVFGAGFDQFGAYVCRFGTATVPAVVVSNTHMHCFSPPGNGLVDFAVDSNAISYRTDSFGNFLKFQYVGDHVVSNIYSVFPVHADIRAPNLTATLLGAGFSEGMLCRFGDVIAQSTFVDEHTLRCDVPPRDLAELVDVSVSHDGGHSWSTALTQFEYRAQVESIDPPLGHVRGGNVVVVRGRGFNYRVSLCVFGNTVVPATVASQYELSCVAPPSAAALKVPFAVTCNNTMQFDPYLEFSFTHPTMDRWGTWYVYSYRPDYYVASLEPAEGSSFGGSRVMVHGEGFDATSHCMFGQNIVKATFLDAATLLCEAPPHAPGDVEFKVSVYSQQHGYNVSALERPFRYAPPEIHSVAPAFTKVAGGEVVTVRGRYLGGVQSCRFGRFVGEVLPGGREGEVQCRTPRVDGASTVPLSLEYSGAGSTTGDVLFSFHPEVVSFSPLSALINDDRQHVMVHGAGFSGDSLRCTFGGDVSVPAIVRSTAEIECHVPLQTTPHATALRLVNDQDQDLGGEDFTFQYVVQSVHPKEGPVTGNTTVVVVGAKLGAVTHCSFDGELTPAVVVSEMMVRCRTPASSPRVARLTLVTTDGNDGNSNGLRFQSNPTEFAFKVLGTHVTSIHPTAGSSGGGTLVTVRGAGFGVDSFCRFGDREVPVTYYAPDHVTCYSPPAAADTETVAVEVSQMAGGEGYSTDGFSFAYHANVSTINRIEPTWAAQGDSITVIGSNFVEASTCFFGGRAAETTFVSASVLTCVVPEVDARPTETVQVGTNPAFLPGGHIVFSYVLPTSGAASPAVRELQPSHGPANGGTVVEVVGVQFPDNAQCRFGELFVPATVVSSQRLTCTSPPHHSGSVVVEVVQTDDRAVFSTSSVRFSFQASGDPTDADILEAEQAGLPVLDQLVPSEARVGDTVTLIGQKFSSVGYCVFKQDAGSKLVTARLVDSAHAECEVPEPVGAAQALNATVSYMSVAGHNSDALAFSWSVPE